MRTRPLFLLLLLTTFIGGCYREDTARWQPAQQASIESSKAVTEAALPGATFNKFFPKVEGEMDIVFKQEKTGFAQASLQRGGTPLGMLSIFDTRSNPTARDKYKDATAKVGDYPAVSTDNTTSILVADRFQVQVQSEADALPAEDRMRWLEKFDLAGLAAAL